VVISIPPDLEALVQKRLESGAYSNAEEVFRRALEAQDAEESWTEDERRVFADFISQRFRRSESCEPISAEQAKRQIRERKASWLAQRAGK
jgi:Arc/MetJ-type ribon-helix-helix transcriptional regulator